MKCEIGLVFGEGRLVDIIELVAGAVLNVVVACEGSAVNFELAGR